MPAYAWIRLNSISIPHFPAPFHLPLVWTLGHLDFDPHPRQTAAVSAEWAVTLQQNEKKVIKMYLVIPCRWKCLWTLWTPWFSEAISGWSLAPNSLEDEIPTTSQAQLACHRLSDSFHDLSRDLRISMNIPRSLSFQECFFNFETSHVDIC